MRNAFYKIFRSVLELILGTMVKAWYATDRDKDNLICWSIGAKNNNHDFTIKVNRY